MSRARPAWTPALLVVIGTACLVAAVPVFRNGVVDHAFPSYVQNDPSYSVARWSAPWVGGAVALGGIGLLCWLLAVGQVRSLRRRPAPVAPGGPRIVDVSEPSGLAPRPTQAASEY
ncbi:MAG: hypothetical protein ABIR83_05535 [Nakamurella sp.]